MKPCTIIGCEITNEDVLNMDVKVWTSLRDEVGGFKLVQSAETDDNGPRHFVAPFISFDFVHVYKNDIISLNHYWKHTKETLEPVGLWNENTFGIHTVLVEED